MASPQKEKIPWKGKNGKFTKICNQLKRSADLGVGVLFINGDHHILPQYNMVVQDLINFTLEKLCDNYLELLI